MFERLKRALGRRRDPERMREDTENRLRAQQELRQAELRKSEDQRGVEGSSQMPPLGRP
jgi:hypothetical protein